MISVLVKFDRLEEAEKLFDEMPVRNVISYTVMVDGWVIRGEVKRVRAVFDWMPKRNLISWAVQVCG